MFQFLIMLNHNPWPHLGFYKNGLNALWFCRGRILKTKIFSSICVSSLACLVSVCGEVYIRLICLPCHNYTEHYTEIAQCGEYYWVMLNRPRSNSPPSHLNTVSAGLSVEIPLSTKCPQCCTKNVNPTSLTCWYNFQES